MAFRQAAVRSKTLAIDSTQSCLSFKIIFIFYCSSESPPHNCGEVVAGKFLAMDATQKIPSVASRVG